MIRESLKQELDTLNEGQLVKIAGFIASIKVHVQPAAKTAPFWQRATYAERAQELREWVASAPETGISLPDEAFDRGTIYD